MQLLCRISNPCRSTTSRNNQRYFFKDNTVLILKFGLRSFPQIGQGINVQVDRADMPAIERNDSSPDLLKQAWLKMDYSSVCIPLNIANVGCIRTELHYAKGYRVVMYKTIAPVRFGRAACVVLICVA